jgi:tetratricopeptide (TPR) repeat protein
MEAYQYYVEGLQLDLQVRLEEAVPYLRKAVEIDPAFAMAHARLGWIYQNLGRATESAESLGIAFENADRLPGRERYLVEGLHYNLRWDTYHLAVDAFQNALKLDRSMNSTRHQLATVYAKLEMYKEAIEVWDALLSNNYRYPGVENGLAITNAALGQFEPGESIIRQFLVDNPDNAMMHVSLGWHYTSWGKIEQAMHEFVAADELLPAGSPFLLHGILRAQVVDHDYVAARSIADQLVAAGDPYSMFLGLKNLARLNLLSGLTAEALTTLEQAVAAYPTANAFTALARLRTASVLMETGQGQEAIVEAQRAIEESLGEWPEWEARFLIASAEYSLGNTVRAEEIVDEISQQAARQPDQILNRMLHHLRGRFAMVRGEHAQAVEELEMASALLSVNGVEFHFQRNPDHASVWYDLGMANLQADRLEEAHKWFTRIVESRIERSLFPVEYVRSYYQLGRLAERLDRQDEAQRNFSKFLEYWGKGSLDLDWVEYARSHAG